MTSPLVSHSTAIAKRIHHQFIQGVGYVAHSGPPELSARANGTKNCDPPAGTAAESMHLLRPPTGGVPLAFLWIPKENAWASVNPGKGNRMAWTTDHLRRAGWEYLEPIKVS